MKAFPDLRVRAVNAHERRAGGDWVLYWMTAFRRPDHNFALQRAADHAADLGKPLLVLEALRAGYPWASRRLHRFIIEGMADNAAAFAGSPVLYHPYVEPEAGAGKGLLAALSERACVVVADDYPAFFLPRMVAAAAQQVPVLMEAVDSNGLLPLRAAEKAHSTAYAFRRYLQKTLPEHLAEMPRANPLARLDLPVRRRLPQETGRRWPAAAEALLACQEGALANLPVPAEPGDGAITGGWKAARRRWKSFLDQGLEEYAEGRSEPLGGAASDLSAHLHFGHLSSHRMFRELARREEWSPARLAEKASGSRAGWWGMSAPAEAYLDQFVTWREVGFNTSVYLEHHEEYRSLPGWARETLDEHRDDEREFVYGLEEFEAAATHDPVWNAAQNQLRQEGRLHNYMRMLWGKKILDWSASPEEALEIMVELNNRYALDGRDPNSWSGILWCLGRYDRPWFERPVFGKIRFMSSASTLRKHRTAREYVKKYTGGD